MIQRFNNLSNKVQLGIAAFFIVFVIALLVLQISSISALNHEIETERDLLLSAQQRLNQLKKIAANYKEYETKIVSLEKAMPQTLSEETIMTSVQATASISSNEVPSIAVSKAIPKGDYQEVPITITLSGSFSKFIELVKNIKASERAIKIDSISLNKDNQKGLKATIKASAFINAPGKDPKAKK